MSRRCDLCAKWAGYLDDTGRYRKGAVETSRRHSVRVALREFCDMFGNVPIATRGSPALEDG